MGSLLSRGKSAAGMQDARKVWSLLLLAPRTHMCSIWLKVAPQLRCGLQACGSGRIQGESDSHKSAGRGEAVQRGGSHHRAMHASLCLWCWRFEIDTVRLTSRCLEYAGADATI
eukprot:6173984-Pleurochrysis_carterae.AAC.2